MILDCTDHPTSRYLISDAAKLCHKLLITASATKTSGQLMTLCHNWPAQPCYRCIFPKPPSPENVQSCSEAGILGPAVGVMGTLMAVEAIKYVTHFGAYNNNVGCGGGGLEWGPLPALMPTLLLYSAFETAPFRTTYRAKQRKDCALCASPPAITRASLQSGSMDYELFCGLRAPLNILPAHRRISAQDFNDRIRRSGSQCVGFDDATSARKLPKSYILLDVREAQDFAMCGIAGSVNLPFSLIEKRGRERAAEHHDGDHPRCGSQETGNPSPLRRVENMLRGTPNVDKYFICRYGNDSQLAVRYFVWIC